MNDVDAAAEAKRLLYNYEVKCLNGWAIRIASPLDMQTFWKIAKADGCVTADKAIIQFSAIVTVEFIGLFDPNGGAEVTPLFGRQPIAQAQHAPPTKPS